MPSGGAATPSSEEFDRLVGPYRRELLAYCYRMLGSVHDAEDAVQETLLRAWRFYEGFEGRSSVRGWLYRIATNVCLTALERRDRRPLPSDLRGPEDDPRRPLAPARSDIAWFQPIPDTLLGVGTAAPDPATVVVTHESVRLALVAALQHLPARQRAVLILRDVLAWRAQEAADLLNLSTDAVNALLRRARSQLAAAGLSRDDIVEPDTRGDRTLLDQYIAAFEHADVARLTRLLREDATFEMPPLPLWFTGREAIGHFLRIRVFQPSHAWRLSPTRANGHLAAAAYLRDADGVYQAHSIAVLVTRATAIQRLVTFLDSDLFPQFGMPRVVTGTGRDQF